MPGLVRNARLVYRDNEGVPLSFGTVTHKSEGEVINTFHDYLEKARNVQHVVVNAAGKNNIFSNIEGNLLQTVRKLGSNLGINDGDTIWEDIDLAIPGINIPIISTDQEIYFVQNILNVSDVEFSQMTTVLQGDFVYSIGLVTVTPTTPGNTFAFNLFNFIFTHNFENTNDAKLSGINEAGDSVIAGAVTNIPGTGVIQVVGLTANASETYRFFLIYKASFD